MKVNIVNDINTRLIYNFFIRTDISSIYDDNNYVFHFACIKYIYDHHICFKETFDLITFIISINTQNENANILIEEFKNEISNILIESNVEFIIEDDNKNGREGYIFKKYILDKLNDYDGLTLFFHNKRLRPTYPQVPLIEDNTYWIIGQYYFNMCLTKEHIAGFYRNKQKLIFGWPYMHDNYHPQWLIGGNCFWMKCKEIYKYINLNNLENKPIAERCIGEYYFPEIFDKQLIDYPCSNIIKDYLDVGYYEPCINDAFHTYLKNTLPYNTYIYFKYWHDNIINTLNKS